MSDRSTFTAEEWDTLMFAPLWMAGFVGKADQDMDNRETAAMLKDVSKAELYKQPLVREILSGVADRYRDVLARFVDDPRTAERGLRDTREILDAKADDEEARNVKRSVLGLGVHVAKASGAPSGESASTEEKERMAMAATLLGVPLDEVLSPKN